MKKFLVSAALFATPLVAIAQVSITKQPLTDGYRVLDLFNQILRFAVPFLISLSIVYFLYAVFKFISSGNNEDGRAEAKSQLIYAIVALAVMVSVYGLINFVTNTVGVNQAGTTVPIPQLPTPSVRY